MRATVLYSFVAGTRKSEPHFAHKYSPQFFFDFRIYSDLHCGQTFRNLVSSIIPTPSHDVGFSQAVLAAVE